jgi:hypothetical protein
LDPVTRQTLALKQSEEVRILQKVNAATRDAFAHKYPGQVEHCLRLVMERLQAGLDKRVGIDIADPDTWLMSTIEIRDLAEAAHQLNQIRRGF